MGKEEVKKDNKSNSEIKSNSLFDFDEIKTTKKSKKNDNINNSICSGTNNSISNSKKNSKKDNGVIRKTRQSNSNSTKVATKSKRGVSKAKENVRKNENGLKNISKISESIISQQPKQEIKVGRRDRKHNWWKGCDYVWVDGIDHWVSKSAFRNEVGKEVYTLNNYVQGLDSYWVLRYKPEQKKK